MLIYTVRSKQSIGSLHSDSHSAQEAAHRRRVSMDVPVWMDGWMDTEGYGEHTITG